MAMALCCLARTFSPPVLGIVYSAGGSATAWLTLFGFAASGTLQLVLVPRSVRSGVGPVVVDNPVLPSRGEAAAVENGNGPRPSSVV